MCNISSYSLKSKIFHECMYFNKLHSVDCNIKYILVMVIHMFIDMSLLALSATRLKSSFQSYSVDTITLSLQNTALILSASYGYNRDTVRELLSSGASVDQVDVVSNKNSTLHACIHVHVY